MIGGSNFVAVRYSNAELAPFFGAGARFFIASFLFLGATRLARVGLPQGAALIGAVLFGLINFSLGYAFAYYALQQVSAGTASVLMAMTPLLTVVLAVAHGIERFRSRALIGALIGLAGIAVVFFEQLSVNVQPVYLAAMLGSALSAAEATVLVKRFPRTHPLSTNAVAAFVGGVLLLAMSFGLGESHALPERDATRVAFAYLATIGTVGLFAPLLFVVNRWTASATSYVLLAAPLVAISLGAVLRGEPVSASFLVGAVIVLAGVYIGALSR